MFLFILTASNEPTDERTGGLPTGGTGTVTGTATSGADYTRLPNSGYPQGKHLEPHLHTSKTSGQSSEFKIKWNNFETNVNGPAKQGLTVTEDKALNDSLRKILGEQGQPAPFITTVLEGFNEIKVMTKVMANIQQLENNANAGAPSGASLLKIFDPLSDMIDTATQHYLALAGKVAPNEQPKFHGAMQAIYATGLVTNVHANTSAFLTMLTNNIDVDTLDVNMVRKILYSFVKNVAFDDMQVKLIDVDEAYVQGLVNSTNSTEVALRSLTPTTTPQPTPAPGNPGGTPEEDDGKWCPNLCGC